MIHLKIFENFINDDKYLPKLSNLRIGDYVKIIDDNNINAIYQIEKVYDYASEEKHSKTRFGYGLVGFNNNKSKIWKYEEQLEKIPDEVVGALKYNL